MTFSVKSCFRSLRGLLQTNGLTSHCYIAERNWKNTHLIFNLQAIINTLSNAMHCTFCNKTTTVKLGQVPTVEIVRPRKAEQNFGRQSFPFGSQVAITSETWIYCSTPLSTPQRHIEVPTLDNRWRFRVLASQHKAKLQIYRHPLTRTSTTTSNVSTTVFGVRQEWRLLDVYIQLIGALFWHSSALSLLLWRGHQNLAPTSLQYTQLGPVKVILDAYWYYKLDMYTEL